MRLEASGEMLEKIKRADRVRFVASLVPRNERIAVPLRRWTPLRACPTVAYSPDCSEKSRVGCTIVYQRVVTRNVATIKEILAHRTGAMGFVGELRLEGVLGIWPFVGQWCGMNHAAYVAAFSRVRSRYHR
jgi:hypothetical protein